jgi:aspartokinase-like uncharacterized kinase
MTTTVVKIGGSLLDRPGFPSEIEEWLASQPSACVVVGGGDIIEAIRRLDSVHRLPAGATHWLCVRMLRHTAELVASWIPDATLIETAAGWQRYLRLRPAGVHIVPPDLFYRPELSGGLPTDWRTTSDAIAGLLAQLLNAQRLVLWKSREVPPEIDLEMATLLGIVDPVLRQVVPKGLSIHWHCPRRR